MYTGTNGIMTRHIFLSSHASMLIRNWSFIYAENYLQDCITNHGSLSNIQPIVIKIYINYEDSVHVENSSGGSKY